MLRRAMDTRLRELEAENADLRRENEQLRRENEQLRRENEQLRREIVELRGQLAKLAAALEEARRSGKRQAAPFRKTDVPKPEPKKSGRKPGRRHGPHAHRTAIAPEQIDEQHDAPLPRNCPHCGGRHILETHTATQYQTEIPRRPIHRQFTIHVGTCRHCGRRVQGRHPLQTSDALGAAASQFGPDAHAAFVTLNKGLGLAHGKCQQFFRDVFGIRLARSTSVRSLLRTATRVQSNYEQLRRAVRCSPWVVPDETGWRVGGRSAWLHVFVSEKTTCYEIGDRGGEIAERLLGLDWRGTLIHDGWSVYNRFTRAFHQQCLGHLQRRCQELLETAVGGAVHLPRRVLALVDEAFWLRRQWRGHRLNGDQLVDAGLGLACRLEDLVSGRFTYEPNRRLADHILGHAMHWFWFLIDPTIDATNYRAEQAIRPAVVNRKVWGGNRTWRGAWAQGILTSLLVTLAQRGHHALSWFSAARRGPIPLPLPP
jgi:transposase